MDLVAGVRKEGSRGGRDAFKWSDVKESQHRENYLGHSLMAPVGRWQQGKDLSWYAKADKGTEEADAAENERQAEIRRVKEAEEEALARALGLPVPPKSSNANLTPLGGKEVERAIKESAAGDDDEPGEGGKGVGFGGFNGMSGTAGADAERMEGVGMAAGRSGTGERRSYHERERRRDRSKDRGGDRDRDRRSRRHEYERDDRERRRRHRSRSRDHDRRRRHRSRSVSRDRRRDDDRRHHRRDRSRSPDGRRDSHRHRERDRYDRR